MLLFIIIRRLRLQWVPELHSPLHKKLNLFEIIRITHIARQVIAKSQQTMDIVHAMIQQNTS